MSRSTRAAIRRFRPTPSCRRTAAWSIGLHSDPRGRPVYRSVRLDGARLQASVRPGRRRGARAVRHRVRASLPPYEQLLLGGARCAALTPASLPATSGSLVGRVARAVHLAASAPAAPASMCSSTAARRPYGERLADPIYRGAGAGLFLIVAVLIQLNLDVAHSLDGQGTRVPTFRHPAFEFLIAGYAADARMRARMASLHERPPAANQRNAVLAGFLGWTLDAFDFFILTLVIEDLAQPPLAAKTRPHIALADHADAGDAPDRRHHLRHDGRPLRPPAAADDQRHLLRHHLGPFRPGAELLAVPAAAHAVRHRHGRRMGRRRVAGARIRVAADARTALGPAAGRLRASATCSRRSRSAPSIPWANARYPGNGWRIMFFLGGLPALLSLFIRMRVKESEAWHEHRTDWADATAALLQQHARRFFYLVLLMTMMNFMSHGTQDMYPTLLRTFGYNKARIADITMLSMVGAVHWRPGLRRTTPIARAAAAR